MCYVIGEVIDAWRGLCTKYSLTEKEVVAIEKVLNKSGPTEAIVKIENGAVVVLQTEKKRIV